MDVKLLNFHSNHGVILSSITVVIFFSVMTNLSNEFFNKEIIKVGLSLHIFLKISLSIFAIFAWFDSTTTELERTES